MKLKNLFATALLCTLSVGASAQTTMRINMEGGKQMDIPVSFVTRVTWVNCDENSSTPDVSPAGVQAIDLGLPSDLKWANMNVGAESIDDCGDYFAWGETVGYKSGKTIFDKVSYKWYQSTTTKDADGFDVVTEGFTKYVRESDADKYGYDGFYDNKTVLDLEDDAAHVNWGGDWRMPTPDELEELRDCCTWKWTALNGTNGYKVTGPNGNSLFLPAAGSRYFYSLSDAGSYGDYWSSSLDDHYSSCAYYLCFESDGVGWNYYARCYGHSVRAVCP